jgi:hypothetical protein
MSGGYFQFQAPQLRVISLRNTTAAKKRQISEVLARVKNKGATEQICEEVIQRLNDLFCGIYEVSADERAVLEAE